ncbi:MAG: ribonuclease HII [archaeon]
MNKLILGIDDAGRGPVIGPMVLAGAIIDKKDEKKLKLLGVKDSKQVSASKREILIEEIKKTAIDWKVEIITPAEIDGRSGAGLNLNQLEAVKAAAIVNNLNNGKESMDVVVDCPSNNIPKWQEYLLQHINNKKNLVFKIEHKADINHVACSAASIIAKVTRDSEIEKIKKNLGVDFGSGYPSDPVTIKFLHEHGKKYRKEGIFRETWQTWQDAKGKKAQKKIDEF